MASINKKSTGAYLLFILSPVISIIYAIFNLRSSWSKNIVWLFTVFFGYSFIISPSSTADSVHYAKQLEMMFNAGWNINIIFTSLYISGDYVDLYQPLLTFFISRVSNNYNILFAFFGLVLGYFYSRNIWLVIDHVKSKIPKYSLILLFVLFLIIPISDGINGVRYYTAAHVFVFGIMIYFLKGNKRGLIIAGLSFLFHWSFFIAFFLFLIYLALGNRKNTYFFLFFLSFFISQLNFNFLTNYLSIIPLEGIESKSKYYLDEKYIDTVQKTVKSFYLVLLDSLMKFSIFSLVSYVWFVGKNTSNKLIGMDLFSFSLFLFAVVNILSTIPSFGRFLVVAEFLIFSVLILNSFTRKIRSFNLAVYLFSPIFLFYFIVKARIFINYIDWSFIFGNLIINAFIEKGIPLGERYF